MVIFFKTLIITIIIITLTAILGMFLNWREKYIKICFITAITCTMILLTTIIICCDFLI